MLRYVDAVAATLLAAVTDQQTAVLTSLQSLYRHASRALNIISWFAGYQHASGQLGMHPMFGLKQLLHHALHYIPASTGCWHLRV
jgi:hypothetical protein